MVRDSAALGKRSSSSLASTQHAAFFSLLV
jgi:hypothetical protein